jgi:murein L,D-transpeptidase YafK
MNVVRLALLAMTLVLNTTHAQDFLPSHLIALENRFAHHVLLVEKSTHTLFVYENKEGFPHLVKSFKIASGKNKGDKFKEGDRKTPEGIYSLNNFFSDEILKQRHGDMAKMYGAGAFTTDYPNLIDQRLGKTGSGIWLHSTDDATRIDKGLDSRGCVVVNDIDLKSVALYLDLPHTPMIIVQDITYLSRKSWEKSRNELMSTIEGWANAWKGKRFDDYISYYHQTEFKDRSRGGFQAYRTYKQAVFSRQDNPRITIDSISILYAENYAVVTLRQDYRSTVINDTGKKTLYLKQDENYDWKIVAEIWQQYPDDANVAFTPSARFFKE